MKAAKGTSSDKEKGAVAAVAVVILTVLMLILAVVIDIGILYHERRQLQTATDAAALAAAIDLGEGKSADQARETALKYVFDNADAKPSAVSVDFPDANKVRVSASTERSMFFSGFIGAEALRVTAKSTASWGAASAVANLVPFIVPVQKVSDHIGEANVGTFQIGEDRPLDPFSKIQTANGSTITYTITYNNTESKAKNVKIWDFIPSGTEYVVGSAIPPADFDRTTKKISWEFSNVQPDDFRTMRFSVTSLSNSVTGIENTAYLAIEGTGKTISASAEESPQRAFFWLVDFDDGRGGVPDYAKWIRTGYPDYVSVGSLANGEGVKASLEDALAWRKAFSPRMLVPVYSYTERGGSQGKYRVVGFAEFVLVDYDFRGNPKTITGYFTGGTVAKGISRQMPEAYYGVDAVWLVE